ncbi:MAG: AMP-binding protein [Actinobacteria bacterium]|nr:AMP-binding protein [Actinomycetota bacterium]MCB9390520.1 AMP-binding protein [Acidimicrobiia bacterium]
MSTTPAARLETYNFADIWEAVSDTVAEREALICGSRRLTYAQLEERANRLASVLSSAGIGRDDRVGCFLQNGTEYVETMLAAFKLRAIPININFRYNAAELAYLVNDAALSALIFDTDATDTVEGALESFNRRPVLISVDDAYVDHSMTAPVESDPSESRHALADVVNYETALIEAQPSRVSRQRSSSDSYIIYTGGTTGMPKGVVWDQEHAFFACIGGGDPLRMNGPVSSPDEVLERVPDFVVTQLPIAPLMHAAAQWTVLSWLYAGGRIVLTRGNLNPATIWSSVVDEAVNVLVIVGDAVARPLMDQWDAAGGYDVASLYALGSGGAPLTQTQRARLARAMPQVLISDGYGSSETGAQGTSRTSGDDAVNAPDMRFETNDETAVFGDDLSRVQPGSGDIGRVALSGHIPRRYWNDPIKTAETMVEIDGVTWMLTGDMATVDTDGAVRLMGRGSSVINSGGEKVFAEEVEAALKSHADVYDALVVGIPDERFGQGVAAIVAWSGDGEPDGDTIVAHVKTVIAPYKAPRSVVFVSEIKRSPAGKPDYTWAKAVATGAPNRD